MRFGVAIVALASWLSIGSMAARADYEIAWYVFASGGGSSGNGAYEIRGTVGQPNATESAGSDYAQGAGFWRNAELCFTPVGASDLSVQRSGADLELSWSAVSGAVVYDVIRGDLTTLRSTAGDFSAATNGCVVDGTSATSNITPAGAGESYFLVRPVACAPGSYDSVGSSQADARDAEINAAVSGCP